ncbi:MAG: hypothetical protein C5B52_17190 [Bacteroidetes bacterium]|nr:MAG: hypothetical protein C5B52_17190 [Bacteroidota bacterium]
MIKLSEIKVGDIVNARFEDVVNTGEVLQVDREEKKALVTHGDTEYWYDINDLSAVSFSIDTLGQMGFRKSEDPSLNGTGLAYIKGPFIVRFPDKTNTKHMVLTYRDEHRDLNGDLFVHQFQNHYHSMTNFHIGLE